MRVIDPLIMEFDREAATTRRVLERVPQDQLAWKPHPKSKSIGELANHIATVPSFIAATLPTDGFVVGSRPAPPTPATVAEILQNFEAACAAVKGAMAQLDDEKAMGGWTMRMGDQEIFSMPRAALVRTILLNHSYHHRGQLTVYLRLLDVPVPSVYGPTADENPFAGAK